ncbi:MAG: FecR domain-containing protein [Gammaproteobacteria bacterium]|nr:FecR domain-containing protein [Gammaproteobacteria bacterium]
MLLLLAVNPALSLAESNEFKVEKRFLYVQPGQTVFSIVKVLYPDQKKRWPAITQEILKTNPEAFYSGDITRIRIGARIELPLLSSNFMNNAMLYSGVESVGQVVEARGKTFAISSKKKKRNLFIGSEIFVGDRLFTGGDGFMRLNMIDDAKIDLRCNSEMLIEDYRLMRAGNRSVLYLIKGSLRKITGSIGKLANDVYEMRTPMATVGVRGTEYALRVMQSYGCDGTVDVDSDGLFVRVDVGVVDLKNNSGLHALTAGNAAIIKSKSMGPYSIDVDDAVFGFGQDSWYWWLLGILLIAVAI